MFLDPPRALGSLTSCGMALLWLRRFGTLRVSGLGLEGQVSNRAVVRSSISYHVVLF